MINDIENQKSNIIKRRPKRTFTLREKQKLYDEWQKSGLTMTKFCKEKDLIHSAFSNWRKKFSSEQTPSNNSNWIPVVTKKNIKPANINIRTAPIDLNITTQILIALLLFFMVLDYAIKVIW